MALDERAGDYYCTFPVPHWQVSPQNSARILEISGPQTWHAICVDYPAVGEDCRLVPDWGAVEHDWDAVHMSFVGFLTTEQVRVESQSGWSKLEFWHAEQTVWLRWLFDDIQRRLPDHERNRRPDYLRLPYIEANANSGVQLARVHPTRCKKGPNTTR